MLSSVAREIERRRRCSSLPRCWGHAAPVHRLDDRPALHPATHEVRSRCLEPRTHFRDCEVLGAGVGLFGNAGRGDFLCALGSALDVIGGSCDTFGSCAGRYEMRGGTDSALWYSCKWKSAKARAASHGRASLCGSAFAHRTTRLVDTLMHPTIRFESPPLLPSAETLTDSSQSSSRDTKGWRGQAAVAMKVSVGLRSVYPCRPSRGTSGASGGPSRADAAPAER